MATSIYQWWNSFTVLLLFGFALLSNTGNNTILESDIATNLNSTLTLVVTITIVEFLAIQQRIVNLEAAQQNPGYYYWSDSELGNKYTPSAYTFIARPQTTTRKKTI